MKALLLLGFLVVATGCVERGLTIRSEPSGATVILSGRVLERPTPVRVPIEHHGAYRVEVEMKTSGTEDVLYRRVVRTVETDDPWYENFPFDFFAEVLWPGTLRSETEVLVRLEPLPPEGPAVEEIDLLLDEADASRAEMVGDD